ncbi:receptor-type tyrosine-protein phosphatase F-like [Diadema antillarum]|uniref:receptor-type tyrosine-protein phosphatase F-like n=1 Tax=Diadema antillarum TaxID=105358 RepID=UPI003A87A638
MQPSKTCSRKRKRWEVSQVALSPSMQNNHSLGHASETTYSTEVLIHTIMSLVSTEAPELANSRYSNIQSTQLDLEWDVMFYGNLDITSCTATYSSSPGGEQVVMLGATSPQTVVNLTEYTEYNFTLMCRNNVGDSLPLDYPEQRTFAGAPSAPGNVIVQNPTQTTIDVSWTEPAEPRGPINGYLITATPGGDPFNFTSRALNHTLEGLTPGSLYIIVVQAYNIEGTNGVEVGAKSPPSGTIKTLDARPGPPFNLQIVDNPDNCVVRWEVPREPNGVITGYTLYYQAIGRSSGVLNIEERFDEEGTVHEWERQKSQLHDYSNFRFAVVAKTSVGMGLENATSEETCQTEVGEPVEPPALPTPSPEDITKISFAITMPEFDESNGPHSCYEVIVIQLADPEAKLPTPSLEDTENYSDNIAPGIPYRAVMLEEIPPNRMVTIGDQMKKETRCYTGRNPGPQARRKRSTTNADDLTAVNGPLRAGSYYSTLVRVYSPDSANPSLVYYETGAFSPVVSTSKKLRFKS